jgi:hypothetical protein
MAFGYKYWMVYLPEFNRESFLLFVHNPQGSTKLRDYSSGTEKVLGQPRSQGVLGDTVLGRTRFIVDEHKTTEEQYWNGRTLEFNSRYLSSARSVLPIAMANDSQGRDPIQRHNPTNGRARRGSRRQLQDYVNEHEGVLSTAVIEALPHRFQELSAHIRWVSPIAQDNYIEYRDTDFMRAVGLGESADELATFWPSGGPSWDALAIISDSDGRIRPNVVLVEAKSHIPEIYGSGCQAGTHSRVLIEKALTASKQWCGASADADWTGPLYQSANRFAHLYFIRERLKLQAWLVNLYFIDDPIGPADHVAWNAELQKVRGALGLTSKVPFTIDLFLPALASGDSTQCPDVGDDNVMADGSSVPAGSSSDESVCSSQNEQATLSSESDTFSAWANRWMVLAQYDGPFVPNISERVERLVRCWREPIPGEWLRDVDPQLMGSRYRRGDIDAPNRGEHRIEHDILCRSFDSVTCFGNKVIDGINALPLARDAGGARRANVEADMYLLTKCDGAHRLFLCEVKADCNDAWYAAVESLRQMRLLMSSPESLRVFIRRNPSLSLSPEIPVTGLVLAPPSFYSARGKKANAVGPALRLLARFGSDLGVDARLAVWDSELIQITEWSMPGQL